MIWPDTPAFGCNPFKGGSQFSRSVCGCNTARAKVSRLDQTAECELNGIFSICVSAHGVSCWLWSLRVPVDGAGTAFHLSSNGMPEGRFAFWIRLATSDTDVSGVGVTFNFVREFSAEVGKHTTQNAAMALTIV
jgi:hypothetical protein